MTLKIVALCAVILIVGQCQGVPLTNFHRSNPEFQRPVISAPTALRDSKVPVAGTIHQRLDHFNPSDTTTWEQRFYINEQFYEIGGPIFAMMSLEGAANPDFLRGGQMMELALLYKAKAFLLEERYYGQSKPTLNTSVDNLQYASPAQNVGDFGKFIETIKISHPGAKVIAFGASYGGSHVAWAKQEYPNLIDGAVVSSSPLLAVYGFPQFMEEVSRVMSLADEACVTDLKAAITAVEEVLATENGGETAANLFNLCAPLDTSNPLDVANFFRIFPDAFVLAVETAHSLAVVQDTCNLMTNPLYGATPLDRLVGLRTLVFHPPGCTEVRYDVLLPILLDTTWETPAASSRNYMYQTCSYYGEFTTSDSVNQPFGDAFPVEGFVKFCADVYSPSFDATYIQNGVDATNARFGGLTPNVTNTVFVQGSLDPWRVLGVVENLSETATAIVIEGTSHITDIQSASVSDSDELKAARIQIQELVGQWIS